MAGKNDFFVLKNVVQGFERLNKLNKIYILQILKSIDCTP